jgi:hypothetical protein
LSLLSLAALVGAAGCSSESLQSKDAGRDRGLDADPAACGCAVVGYTLTMSWDCYCQQYNCSTTTIPSCWGSGQWTKGCGLSEFSIETIGGPERWVFDSSGALVGAQQGTDAGSFSCPTDPSLQGYSVRAGQFPDTCDSAVTCQCSPDGGACEPTDAGLTFY